MVSLRTKLSKLEIQPDMHAYVSLLPNDSSVLRQISTAVKIRKRENITLQLPRITNE